jgi:hypothetical protein
MRSGESTPQMSFDLDRPFDDNKPLNGAESISRKKMMLRQNSESGFSGYLKKFDQNTSNRKVGISLH